MARNKVNSKKIMQQISRSSKFHKKLSEGFRTEFEKVKHRTLANFDNHPVSKEIASGPSAGNSSGTLGGYGNLFSFIGFNKASNPLAELRKVLRDRMFFRVSKSPIMKKGKIDYKYRVRIPELALIYAATPMPWEGGSWVEGVETGMSNFGFYMYKKYSGGRSGQGFQADAELRQAIFTPKKYITQVLENFQNYVKAMKNR